MNQSKYLITYLSFDNAKIDNIVLRAIEKHVF